MPRTAAKRVHAGARAAITLALACLLAITFGLSSLAPTAGAPIPAGPSAPAAAESHSNCPVDTLHATFEQPEGGWPDGFPEYIYSDGTFSVYMRLSDDNDGTFNRLDFWDAWPVVWSVFLTGDGQTFEHTEFNEGDTPPVTDGFGLFVEDPQTWSDITIEEIEFCYEPPPPPADCPDGTTYFSPAMLPLHGWGFGEEFGNGEFSTYIYAGYDWESEVDQGLIYFYDAFPGVATVFLTGGGGRAQYPGPDEVYDPPGVSDSDDGIRGSEPGRVVRIEFCYGDPPPPSECPPGTSLLTIQEPEEGWLETPYYEDVYENYAWQYFSNEEFFVRLAFQETKGLYFYFDDASRDIYRIFLWEGVNATEYPNDDDFGADFAVPTRSNGEDPIWFSWYPRLVEICYETPPPPPDASTCPVDTAYFAAIEPEGGWFEGTYADDDFSVALEFDAPAFFTEGGVIPLIVSFSDASRPVRRVFVTDVSNLTPEEYAYAPTVTADEFLSGPDGSDITRVEFCYVPLPIVPPTVPPTLPPTLPPVLPTPTQPQPQQPTDAPTASPTLSPSPSPSPSPTLAPTPSPVITAAPTDAPTPSPSPAPTAVPTASPTVPPTPAESPIAPTLRWHNTIPPPHHVSTDLAAVGFSALLVLLFMLMALFPASLMNETLEANYGTISGWFARGGSKIGAFRNLLAAFWRSRFGVAAFLLLTGLIYGFLDPAFGLNTDSMVLFLGIVAGLTAITILFELPIVLVQRRSNFERGVMRVLPLTIVIALVSVLISRVAEFQPGYLYGLVAFWAFDRELSRRAAGVAVALTCVLILLIALVAWALMPVAQDALAASPLLATFVATFLAVIFIGGLEGLLVELVPLRFLRGRDVWLWRRTVWLVLFAIAGFFFVHVLLNPTVDYLFDVRGEAVAVAVTLFVIFGVASVLFWGYFRYIHKPAPA